MKKLIAPLIVSALLVGGVGISLADDFSWNPPDAGGGGSISWNNGTNWGGSAPANNITDDIAVFNSTTAYNFQPQLDALTVQSINGVQIGGASSVGVTLSAGSGTKTNDVASTSGSSTLTLADVTDLAVGQHVTGAGIGAGTFITAIDVGTNTITLSRITNGNTALGAEVTVNSSLQIGSSGMTLVEGTPNVSNIITAPIVLGANQEWSNDTSNRTLQIQGSIYLDGYTLTLSGSAGSTFSFNGSQGGSGGLRQSIGGTGGVIVDSAGTVSFGSGSGNRMQNTFTGGVTLNSGTITLQGGNAGGGDSGGALGTGVLTINGGAINGGGNIAGHPLTVSGQVWNADWLFFGSRSVDMGTAGITLGTAPGSSRTLTVDAGSQVLTIGGGISNGTTATSFIKSGTSTLLLTGTSTYTGETVVNAGTLIVDGALAGGGNVTVDSGASLSGSGSIAGNTFISGSHRPGNSPGVQTFETDLTYNNGASFEFELAANSSTQGSPTAIFDQVVVGGNLDFDGTTEFAMVFNVGSTVDWTDGFWDSDQSWLVFDVAGATSDLSNLSLVVSNWEDSQGNFFDTVRAGSSFALTQMGEDVYLSYTAIPEPSTLFLAGAGMAMLLSRRRRFKAGSGGRRTAGGCLLAS